MSNKFLNVFPLSMKTFLRWEVYDLNLFDNVDLKIVLLNPIPNVLAEILYILVCVSLLVNTDFLSFF